MIQTINITALTVFTIYIIYVRVVLGRFPKSISQSFYDIRDKNGNINLFFIITLATSATTLVANGYYTAEIGTMPLLAYGGLGIFSVAVFAIFHNKRITLFHYISAVLGFGVSLLAFGIDYGEWKLFTMSLVSGIIVLIISPKKSKIFWVEVVLSYCLIFGLLWMHYLTM